MRHYFKLHEANLVLVWLVAAFVVVATKRQNRIQILVAIRPITNYKTFHNQLITATSS